MTPENKTREKWGSKLGIILAVAGSAIGLGNFLRFPVQAAQNGGGAFMIPYFVSFLLLGLPLMWVEWAIGRYGGGFGHGTAPGVFHSMSNKNRFIKYFGVIGIFGPTIIFIYYVYIESWLLAYAFFALTGHYSGANTQQLMQSFLNGYQGLSANQFFHGIGTAYIFFIITFFMNIFIIYYGIKKGIETLCNWSVPILLLCGIILLVRVITLGAPDITKPAWSISNGLGFLWNPDFSVLKDSKVWLAAAGQIFFTLSVGIGVIMTYASYLTRENDVVLSGLTSSTMNEFAEVILGGSIVIPAAFAFFGPSEIVHIANSGSFNLGFVTMPLIFQKLQFGGFFAFIWFLLLFLAGITSSVSLAQPAMAFMEDEFNISKKRASITLGIITFILCQAPIFLLGRGVLDEMDFWGGTFCLVIFAAIEAIMAGWIFGIDRTWDEIHTGSDLEIPGIFKFIIKYITPLFLLFILGFWTVQKGIPALLMKNIPVENMPYVFMIRLLMLGLFIALCLLVRHVWYNRNRKVEGK